MPYKSKSQARFFHTPTARAKGITSGMVKEFDMASEGMKLPKQAPLRRGLKHVQVMKPLK
jgi:hypothetical protein